MFPIPRSAPRRGVARCPQDAAPSLHGEVVRKMGPGTFATNDSSGFCGPCSEPVPSFHSLQVTVCRFFSAQISCRFPSLPLRMLLVDRASFVPGGICLSTGCVSDLLQTVCAPTKIDATANKPMHLVNTGGHSSSRCRFPATSAVPQNIRVFLTNRLKGAAVTAESTANLVPIDGLCGHNRFLRVLGRVPTSGIRL